MDVQVITENTKKYWPYVVGGVIGLYLVYKFVGGSSGSNSAEVVYSGQPFDPAQAQFALASQQMQLAAANEERALQVQYMGQQALAAKNVASGAAELVSALQRPTIAAINAASAENAATVMSAAALTSASYESRSRMVSAATIAAAMQTQALSNSVNSTSNAVIASTNAAGASVNAASNAAQAAAASEAASDGAIWSTIGTIAAAYFTGGASLAVGAGAAAAASNA